MERIYKEDTPIGTITKIRNLLGEIGIVNYEAFWRQPYEDIFSVRVQSFDENGGFGTNGKGVTREYALASGWAEYIERLQNGALTGISTLSRLLLNNIKEETGYYFFPDEKFLNKDEFKSLPKEYLDDVFSNRNTKITEEDIDTYFNRLNENGFPGVLSVPFYNYDNRDIVYLPFNIILMMTGSNGMAAGNSVAEGTFQGICELLERYAASIIYYNQLTPPSVPLDFLNQFPSQMRTINSIEANGYEVIIKDFSINKKLPVLGILIIDQKKQKYRLNVGSETSFSVALTRVLTEVHQGVKDKENFENLMLPIPAKKQEYFVKNDDDSLNKRYSEFMQFITDSQGVFPFALFNKKESYIFDAQSFIPKENYPDEVKYLLSLINNKLGFNIFLRNTSFLGFPTFYIYIPTISPQGLKGFKGTKFSVKDNIRMDLIEDLFFPFNQLIINRDRIKKLLNIFYSIISSSDNLETIKMKDVLKLDFKQDFYWSSLPLTYFLTSLNFILQDYDKAKKSLRLYMNSTSNNKTKYYKNILKYFELLKQEKPKVIINKSIPSEIINSFSSPEKMFSGIDIPNCPNCANCSLSENCLTKNKISYAKRVLHKQKENQVSVSQKIFSTFH